MLHHRHHHHHLSMEQQQQQRSRWKPSVEVAPNCPRCASTNTKFCYYNNYSLSQPRYFCKGCRRYWTKGGSLRNVPVGGGCRKNRRARSSRHHQSHRLSANDSTSDDRESSLGDAQEINNNDGSRDIDMALVFAKFLNPKPSEDNNNVSSSTSNNYLTPENDAVVDDQSESQTKPVLSDPAVSENFGGEELSLSGIDELERFLGVCGDEEGLWSDATLMSSWQSHAKEIQLQELELEFSMDDIASTMSDTSWSTWGSFDLSTMQVFSSTP